MIGYVAKFQEVIRTTNFKFTSPSILKIIYVNDQKAIKFMRNQNIMKITEAISCNIHIENLRLTY